MFVIEILVVLIHSLKMAHKDEKSLGKYSHGSGRLHVFAIHTYIGSHFWL